MDNPILHKLMAERPLVLASGSPRRKALLEMLGLRFTVHVSDVAEDAPAGLSPAETAVYLAEKKAHASAAGFSKATLIAADTIVVLDGEIIGKPADRSEAIAMLRRLSGRTHRVYTGFSILKTPEMQGVSDVDCTAVTFNEMTEAEIKAYVDTGSPMDKAGAYGIQDQSAVFINRIEGCFYNVVGFPLARFYQTCQPFFAE